MIKKYLLSPLHLAAIGSLLMLSCSVPAQTKPAEEITDQLLDSLSIYPQISQLTLQSDLYYKLFAQKYPSSHEAFMCRSVAYNKTGDHATGFAILNKAVDVAPTLNLGYRAFVKLYMMHDYEGALHDCLKLDSLTSYAKPGVWGEEMDMVIGLCYLQLKDFQKAEQRFKATINEVTKKNGKDWNPPRVFLYLAITLMKEKSFAEANKMLDGLIQLQPNYTEAYYYKALCYNFNNDLVGAEAMLQKCKELFKKVGVEKNPYFEMPYQIYPSMFNKLPSEF